MQIQLADSAQDDRWYMAVGAQISCVGSAVLYESLNLVDWTYSGTLTSQVTVGGASEARVRSRAKLADPDVLSHVKCLQ